MQEDIEEPKKCVSTISKLEEDLRLARLSNPQSLSKKLRAIAAIDLKMGQCKEQIQKYKEYSEYDASIYDEPTVEVSETGAILYGGVTAETIEKQTRNYEWQSGIWKRQQPSFYEEFYSKIHAIVDSFADSLVKHRSWMRELMDETGLGPEG